MQKGIVIHILHHTVSRSNFYWLLKLGSSSGSASPLILPSQFPSDIFKTRSTLQLRDSTGFTPVSLLSIATPNFIYIYLFIDCIYLLQFYIINDNIVNVNKNLI